MWAEDVVGEVLICDVCTKTFSFLAEPILTNPGSE